MFLQLVNHNEDLKRLVQRGYAVAFDSNHLIIRDIPYLNSDLSLQIGTLVAKLVFTDEYHVVQDDHQVYFAGSIPYNIDRKPIPNLGGGPKQITLSEACSDVVVERSFSNKPKLSGKFIDFFEKIESYVAIIAGPAIELHKANPYTFRIIESCESDPIFKYHDTLTSLAEIQDLSAKFKNDIVAIIGLGGTGSYILDFLVKTPVQEIRLFDLDNFYVHNAFRSPGKLESSELGKLKSEVYQMRYENFRNGISVSSKYIDSTCTEEMDGVTFAFVCVDKGISRKNIFDLLLSKNIPFIDVGMGLHRKNDNLNGILRTTYFSTEEGEKVRSMKLVPEEENIDEEYKTNIQIGELNALNACLAIIRYKQIRGFYSEEFPTYNLAFEISDLKIVSESNANED